MFLLQRRVRVKLRELYSSSNNNPTSSGLILDPFVHENNASEEINPKITTISRDFILCAQAALSEAEAIQMVRDSLANGEGILRNVISYSWNTYQNISTYAEVNASPPLHAPANHPSPIAPAEIIVTAIFDGGSLSLHVLPHLSLARASVVNSNSWIYPEDILDTLGNIQRCERSSGITHSGPAPLTHSNTLDERLSHFGDGAMCSIHAWKLVYPYWTSPKIDLRTSLIDGTGNWANGDILKDEAIFRGPIEAELVHLEEYKRYPPWKKDHLNHFGERAHNEILVGPSRGLEVVR